MPSGAIASAATLLGPRHAVVLDVAPLITRAEAWRPSLPVVPGNASKELNSADAGRVVGRGAEIARASGFDAEARATLAAPRWKGIVDADELDAAAIVIGSRGLSGLKEILAGSVSHQVAEHAGRPVLIVPPPHEER
jgi:nucleotide-binding universal stress UspA family protein